MRACRPASLALAALSLLAGEARIAAGQEHEHGSSPLAGDVVGSVDFTTSCRRETKEPFDHAVALLHSFEFGRAIAAFQATAKADPDCSMTQWGIALAEWGNPFAAGLKTKAQLARGADAVAAAARCVTATPRERAYAAAVGELFRDVESRDQRTRMLAYRDAMKALAAAHPEDMEATIFYALSLAQAALPTDKTYADLLEAGGMLERLFATHPDHPGLAHYIIHAYDVPPLAARALPAARRYARIAPSAPHALHMPSHTFTRLGLWQESIETNIASALASRRDGATGEELHATDYQVYAYLQSGQDEAARRLLDSLPSIAARFDDTAIGSAAPPVAGVFALAAIPARWALERGDWAGAARLVPRESRFPQAQAMTHFARALGAARSADAAAAKASVAALRPLQEQLARAGESYWAGQVEVQSRAAAAWLALAEGRKADALEAMRSAAEMEDATEKNAVTPGPLAPARELLGEMLLELHERAQALAEFEATLRREPGRFRTLAGAARAAAEAGDRAASLRYYRQLLETCARADNPGRPELAEARRVASAPSGAR